MTKRSRQPDSYIRMFDALQKNEDDNPTLGIILCSEPNTVIANDVRNNGINKTNNTLNTFIILSVPISAI